MPTRKIADLPPQDTCRDPEHNPPSHRVFTPGIYEHECPSCGYKHTFKIVGGYWRAWAEKEMAQQNEATKKALGTVDRGK